MGIVFRKLPPGKKQQKEPLFRIHFVLLSSNWSVLRQVKNISLKKILKRVGIAIGIPVLLLMLLALLLYLPPVQRWAVKQVTVYASEKADMEIAVGHVRLAFPFDLVVRDVRIVQRNNSLSAGGDTLADIKRVTADVRLWPLLRGRIDVDRLAFESVKLNTDRLIADVCVKGSIERVAVASHGIALSHERVKIDEAILAGAQLLVLLTDTASTDTTESKNRWKIQVDSLDISRSDVTVRMPGDTLSVRAYLGKVVARQGVFDLGAGVYRVGRFDWKDGRFNYDDRFKPYSRGLDYAHVALSDVFLGIDSFGYQAHRLGLQVRQLAFREKSGLRLTELSGQIAMDSVKLYLHRLQLRTPESSLSVNLDMDLNSFDSRRPGTFDATLHASLGKQDMMRLMGDVPLPFKRQYPNSPLAVDGVIRGNLRHAQIIGLNAALPTAFKAKSSGFVANLTDAKRLKADVDLRIDAYRLDFMSTMLAPAIRKMIQIPSGIGFAGRLQADGSRYRSSFTLRQGGGSLHGTAQVNTLNRAYAVQLDAAGLPLQNFLPGKDLHPLSGYIDVKGQGTDLLSARTELAAKARVTRLQYGHHRLDRITADAYVRRGQAHVSVRSRNALLDGSIVLDALTHAKTIRATLSADLDHVDLFHLGLTKDSISSAFCGHIDFTTNLKEYYKVQGLASDITIREGRKTFRPDPINLDLLTRRDTTHAIIGSGDFVLRFNGSGSYKHLLKQIDELKVEAKKQYAEKCIDQLRLRAKFPTADLYLATGRSNFFMGLLSKYGYALHRADINMRSSSAGGLQGKLQIEGLSADSVQLDTLRLNLYSSATGMAYDGQIRNNKDNPQYVFNALFHGVLNERGTRVSTQLFDEQNRLGFALGLVAEMESSGIRIKFYGPDPVLGYKTFKVNNDHYFFVGSDRRVSANIMLKANDGTGIQLLSNDRNLEVLQDITVSLHQFDLSKVLAVIPYTPDITGIMNGDFHMIQTSEEISVSSAVSVDNMFYEKSPMGNLSSEFVYMPKSNGSHSINGILLSEGKEVATLDGTYDKHGFLDATLTLERMPLQVINGFIPDRIFGLQGYGDGNIAVKGLLSKPHMAGEIYLDSSYIFSEPYGVSMRFADDPVRIVDSKLLFENFEMFANNNSPLNISGSFDFSQTDRMMLDVRMRAVNFELIDAKENPRSEAYGKAFVNFFGTMTGPVESLKLRGLLKILGTTDMAYVLKDSELATDTQLEDLVKFTNFKDTTVLILERPKLTGFDMDLSIGVDEGARIVCMLNTDHTNYIDLQGGGDLRMVYNPADQLRLIGRYTLNSGEMKYSLPIIPLKTFHIQNGSYIEFTGDAMNPKLSITATENVKATVNEGTGSGRIVDFACGVKMSQTLANPGVQFIINAPNDMSIQDELNTMSAEGRGKIAITMLVSGMYLTDGNTGSFSMNSALSSFLQSEINSIAGSAMRSIGLDLGMSVDNATTANGAMHTDYNFRFSKRLWSNRLRVIIGGKVSSGEELVADRNDSFFNNVELEYRLNQNASQYLRMFYNNNTYDWLDGMIGEYGVGFTWRRKLAHFKDIFRLRNEKQTLPTFQPVRRDSIAHEN